MYLQILRRRRRLNCVDLVAPNQLSGLVVLNSSQVSCLDHFFKSIHHKPMELDLCCLCWVSLFAPCDIQVSSPVQNQRVTCPFRDLPTTCVLFVVDDCPLPVNSCPSSPAVVIPPNAQASVISQLYVASWMIKTAITCHECCDDPRLLICQRGSSGSTFSSSL